MPKAKEVIEKPASTDPEVDGMFEGDDIDEMIENAEVVSEDSAEESTESDEQETQPEKKEEEVQEEKAEEPKGSKEPVESEETQHKIKIGEREFSEDEAQNIVTRYDKMKEWERLLRQQSMIAANLSEEDIEHIFAATKNLTDKPDQGKETAEAVTSKLELEKEYKLKDEDGVEVVIPGKQIKDILIPVLKDTVRAAVNDYRPVLQKAKELVRKSQDEVAAQHMKEFMNKHDEFRLNPPEGVALREHIANVQAVGSMHPDYSTLKKYNIILTTMQQMNYHDLEEAYNFVYSKHEKEVKKAKAEEAAAKEAQENILKKQDKVSSEKPGGKSVETDDINAFLEELNDPAEEMLKSIGVY